MFIYDIDMLCGTVLFIIDVEGQIVRNYRYISTIRIWIKKSAILLLADKKYLLFIAVQII